MTFIVVFWEGLWGPDGLNYRVKSASVPGPLAGFRWGANLPYFGEQSDNCGYSPHEPKKRDLRGFL